MGGGGETRGGPTGDHEGGNHSPEGAEQGGKTERLEERVRRTKPPTRPGRTRTRTPARDPVVASSDPQGEVLASTRNSPAAPAESPVEQQTVRETGSVSDQVHTGQPPQRTQPKTDAGGTRQGQPHRVAPNGYDAEQAQRPGTPAPQPPDTMSPVFGQPPRAPRSRPVNPGAKAPGMGKGTTASGKPTGAPRATGPDEARRTARGHEARQRGTLPATTTGHGMVPGNNGCRVP